MFMDENKKGINQEVKEELKDILEQSEDKSEAILQAADRIATERYKELIKDIQVQQERAESDKAYRETLNLRPLNREEKDFYEKLKSPKQAITADQIDIIPTSIIDKTMEDIKKESALLGLVTFTPADVKKWITASHSGTFGWGGLTDELVQEVSGEIRTLNIELAKLHVMLIIPKAIRDLSLPFVDKYFMAVLKEVFHDGLEYGYLQGHKENEPVGVYYQIDKSTNNTHTAKTAQVIKNFSPKALAPILKTLCNNGKRTISKLYLVCNPLDRYEFVNPAMYGDTINGGYVSKAFMPIEVIESVNNPQGKALLTIPGVYTMGNYSMKIDEYKETKAIEDADLIIAKTYANGRADDDNCAVVIDVTKLEEYVPKFESVSAPAPAPTPAGTGA